jgi:hypothetical protein
MSNRSKAIIILFVLALFCFSFYFANGFFVIQPIGAVPEGTTIWYLRLGTKLPFISSADGILLERVGGVSILGRAIALGKLSPLLMDRKILVLPYSEILYLISTKGLKFKEHSD